MEEIYPNRVKVIEIGRTYEGRIIKVLRISDDPKHFDKIWIDGGIHGREWMTPSAVTYIIYTMLLNWDNMPYHVKTITWFFVPVLNPDGYDYSWKVDRLWFKNRRKNILYSKDSEQCRGVDLYRNFNINWKLQYENLQPCNNYFAGKDAFSEAETECIREFLSQRRINLKGYLTFHSYGEIIKYPYAFTNVHSGDAEKLERGAIKIAKKIYEIYNTTYNVQQANLPIPISGTPIDWAKILLSPIYTYQVELRSHNNHGFIMAKQEILPVAKEALDIVITFSKLIYEDDPNHDLMD